LPQTVDPVNYKILSILVVILGPTGVGKTNAAIEVARQFNSEILSADSRQIYRELRIGTAIPSPCELAVVKHHFIQTRSVCEEYNASQYETEAHNFLEKYFQNHEIAVLVGGSMMYIDALCKGIDDLPDIDKELRNSLINRFETEGLENLRLELKKLDPAYYASADLKNPKRILHALEICLMTGKPYSSFRTETQKQRSFQIIKIGLNCNREILYSRIDQRVDRMIEEGLVEEARSVYHLKHQNALKTVGYKELFSFFEGNTSLDQAIEQIKFNTHKYARKQLTWFRRDTEIRWFEPEQLQQIIEYIIEITSNERR
jgi:tRNA dimethylallyltransferase